jgi:hypothetical protein
VLRRRGRGEEWVVRWEEPRPRGVRGAKPWMEMLWDLQKLIIGFLLVGMDY